MTADTTGQPQPSERAVILAVGVSSAAFADGRNGYAQPSTEHDLTFNSLLAYIASLETERDLLRDWYEETKHGTQDED